MTKIHRHPSEYFKKMFQIIYASTPSKAWNRDSSHLCFRLHINYISGFLKFLVFQVTFLKYYDSRTIQCLSVKFLWTTKHIKDKRKLVIYGVVMLCMESLLNQR